MKKIINLLLFFPMFSFSQNCELTTSDIQGPFFSEGAPITESIVPEGYNGERLYLSGTLINNCTIPISSGIIDFWQADENGVFDTEGYNYRGKIITDENGNYNLETIIPGKILNGSQYRPAFIHLKIEYGGYSLVTQIYFEGDEDIATDPWASSPSAINRILPLNYGASGDCFATFDIIISAEFGCSDETALNYNPETTEDDGSCQYLEDSSIYGCTDSTAFNYNADANTDESPCYYDDYEQEMQYAFLTESVEDEDYYLYFLIESLSNQLQNLQESLSSAIVEEEVVSDANSFDVLNPLSYNGEFETISIEALEEFIVPSGKTLLINFANLAARVNDIPLFENITFPGVEPIVYPGKIFNVPIVVSENNVVTGTVLGLLINKSYSSVHYYNDLGDTINSLNFTVPDNQTLVITNLLGALPVPYLIDGVTVGYQSENNNILYSNNSISVTPGFFNTQAGFHGFLIDNSNYTYATDYELIDALNEGMDSLSTMSEIVLLENDSISSQNAILTEENEALMAIDYNFDSLQYVADFLSSQVFDLQQELLIPNIDVDMAIGWNMIGFSCPELNSAENALSDIVEELIILKDNNGLVYLPEWNFNGIGDLTPGHGYQLKVTDYILDFNICD